jgi:hypothetical protein
MEAGTTHTIRTMEHKIGIRSRRNAQRKVSCLCLHLLMKSGCAQKEQANETKSKPHMNNA